MFITNHQCSSKAGNNLIFLSAYCLSVGIYYASNVFFGKCMIVNFRRSRNKKLNRTHHSFSLLFILHWFSYIQNFLDTSGCHNWMMWWEIILVWTMVNVIYTRKNSLAKIPTFWDKNILFNRRQMTTGILTPRCYEAVTGEFCFFPFTPLNDWLKKSISFYLMIASNYFNH